MAGTVFSLSQFPVLAGIGGQAQRALAARAHERIFNAGQMIVLEGEPTRSIYFIAEGRVRSQRCSVEGREIVLHDLGPGDCLNLAAVLDGGYNLCTATAASDAVAYALPAAEFRQIVERHPALSLALVSHLTRRVRRLSDAAEGLAFYDVRIRLARCLLTYALQRGSAPHRDPASRADWPCPRYLTQGEMAAQIGTVRDVVGRTLRAFKREGLIRRERGRVVVIDLAGLQREALLHSARMTS
jgi:CRP/FNR family transcriptional regulator